MSCFGQDPYFNCPNRLTPPLSVRAGTARCSLWGGMTKMGSCSSALVRTRRPVPAARQCPEAPAATAGSKVLTSVTVTPGSGRGRRRKPGGQAAAARPGRGVPVNAAVTRRGSSVPPPPWAGETLVRLLCAAAEGFARPAARSVSTGSRRRRARRCPQRSGRTRRGAGLEGSGALPCLGPPLHGGPR